MVLVVVKTEIVQGRPNIVAPGVVNVPVKTPDRLAPNRLPPHIKTRRGVGLPFDAIQKNRIGPHRQVTGAAG